MNKNKMLLDVDDGVWQQFKRLAYANNLKMAGMLALLVKKFREDS